MAILLAVQNWRSYLQFQEFVILTDQKSLTKLTDQRLHTHLQQQVFSKLLGLQYRIVYRPGADNRAADALSRLPPTSAACATVTTLVPNWIQSVITGYSEDAFAKDLLSKLALNSDAVPNYSLQSAILRYRSRIWIGSDSALQHRLISEFHNMRLKQCFAWRGMKSAVQQFVQSYSVCQQSKYDRSRSPGYAAANSCS